MIRKQGAPVEGSRRGTDSFVVVAMILMVGATSGQAQQGAFSTQEGKVAVPGAELHYRVVGDGDPLLLLHGFAGSSREWNPYIPALGRSYRLVIPDLRGHGGSTNPSGVFTHRQSADDVRLLLEALAIKRCKAIGYSSGAVSLLDLAVHDPSRLEAIVLVAGAHRFPDSTREGFKAADADAWARDSPWWTSEVSTWHPGGMQQLRSFAAQIRTFASNGIDGNLTRADFASVSARTLIVHGDRDDVYPVELAFEMYRAIPASTLWVMPNATHEAVFWHRYAPPSYAGCPGCEAADAVFPQIVLRFLAGGLWK